MDLDESPQRQLGPRSGEAAPIRLLKTALRDADVASTMRGLIAILSFVMLLIPACRSESVSCLEHETALSKYSSDLGGRLEPTMAVHCYDSSGRLVSIDGQPVGR